ncbi:unnamed protein product [Orchesella dallaii]|uniref:Uncharacterized protein n=1 Tax=Orchesella dallaii TaxID=48710 RepID=A0ABP1QE37_9HEXA
MDINLNAGHFLLMVLAVVIAVFIISKCFWMCRTANSVIQPSINISRRESGMKTVCVNRRNEIEDSDVKPQTEGVCHLDVDLQIWNKHVVDRHHTQHGPMNKNKNKGVYVNNGKKVKKSIRHTLGWI